MLVLVLTVVTGVVGSLTCLIAALSNGNSLKARYLIAILLLTVGPVLAKDWYLLALQVVLLNGALYSLALHRGSSDEDRDLYLQACWGIGILAFPVGLIGMLSFPPGSVQSWPQAAIFWAAAAYMSLLVMWIFVGDAKLTEQQLNRLRPRVMLAISALFDFVLWYTGQISGWNGWLGAIALPVLAFGIAILSPGYRMTGAMLVAFFCLFGIASRDGAGYVVALTAVLLNIALTAVELRNYVHAESLRIQALEG